MQGPVSLVAVAGLELVADRLVHGLGEPGELADVEEDPARQVVLVLPRDEQHLGDDHPRLGDEAAAGLGHHLDLLAEAVAHHAHHLGGIVLGRRQRQAVEGREAAADVEDAQARGPASAASVQRACAASSALAHMAGSRTWLPGWKEMPATSRPR